MEFELKFGKGSKKISINANNYLGSLRPKPVEASESEDEIIERALRQPIGSKNLKDMVHSGEKVLIVTSDITRPMPSSKVLPYVIKALKDGGVLEEDITIVLALGSHRNHTEEEKAKIVGPGIYASKIQVLDSNMKVCTRLGVCKNGTPVDVFTPVAEADRVICLGNIEYHYFAGYSGGAKAIMPGVSSYEAIQANHKNMVQPGARAGNLLTNPVRQDIDQVPDFLHIDFIVNVVLNQSKKIIGAFAGHWLKAHRKGCIFLDEVYGVKLEALADIAVVSPGGFPKDLNLYQSQKGLDNAKHAVKKGGSIILCASAKDGFGEGTFESFMKNLSPLERVEEIKRAFRLGGHKAAAIGQVQMAYQVILVSDLNQSLVEQIGFYYAKNLQDALEKAYLKQGKQAKVLLMPAAGSTLPLFEAE